MALKRCKPCSGSGKVMGGGMVFTDCDECNGRGKIEIVEQEIDYLLAKNTEGYNQAKEKIKKLDDKITDEQAENLLDEELDKLKEDTSGPGTVRAKVEDEDASKKKHKKEK